jgi:hypothetical protein
LNRWAQVIGRATDRLVVDMTMSRDAVDDGRIAVGRNP